MTVDTTIRRALRASVFFNAGGVLVFLFPDSLGRLAGLPGPVPRVYGAVIAVFVALFGGAYAWLAARASGAPGKTGDDPASLHPPYFTTGGALR